VGPARVALNAVVVNRKFCVPVGYESLKRLLGTGGGLVQTQHFCGGPRKTTKTLVRIADIWLRLESVTSRTRRSATHYTAVVSGLPRQMTNSERRQGTETLRP
jgi:hypothetical protein